MQKKDEKDKENNEQQLRVRLPKENEVIGIIEQRLGGNKMLVNCFDGKTRNCRVPGRLKRDLWLRPGDVVVVELWEFDNNKGDIVFKYKQNQIDWLKEKGLIKKEELSF
jgi:translation initiation factor 1A